MQLNLDCVRDILLTVETTNLGERISFDNLCLLLPKYSEDEIQYCCLKLKEAGFLDISTVRLLNATVEGIKSINCLTYIGHEFLNNIKSDNIWSKTKDIATNIGSFSLGTLKNIAVNVFSEVIKRNI